jgi:DNA-binding HxlR family transcriptional regulator
MKSENIRKQAPVPMQDCGMCASTAVLSDKWTLLIIREAFYGVMRFEDILNDIGIPRAVLSGRLKTLVEQGVLIKRTYQEEGARPRAGYYLSAKGKDLAPVFIAMMQWGDKYYRQAEPAITVLAKDSKKPVELGFVEKSELHTTYSHAEIDFMINKKP